MGRYRLTIAYDGTDFCGWQRQAPIAERPVREAKVIERMEGESGARLVRLRTVQEVVERAAERVLREPVVVQGASRTDAGVHARGQAAAVTTGAAWVEARGCVAFTRALNAELPGDVVVRGAEAVGEAFDPVADAVEKTYTYTLHVSRERPLFDRRYVHHVWVELDARAMAQAAERLVGEHDFAGFAAAGHGRLSTVRRVLACVVKDEEASGPEWAEAARRVVIEVTGTGFLYNMVRIMAGTLVEVGRGRMTAEDVSGAIASRERRRAGPTLPPTGLCLERVVYR